jgi:hypothetical protein
MFVVAAVVAAGCHSDTWQAPPGARAPDYAVTRALSDFGRGTADITPENVPQPAPPEALRPCCAFGAGLEARIHDGRKLWKLSPMDLRSYSRWYDYSKTRDEMFAASDRDFAPWFVADSNDRKRVRLNIIHHLLSQVPYEERPREKVKLPRRQKRGKYRESDHPVRHVPAKY